MDDNKKLLTQSITCPECQNAIDLDSEIMVGDIVECPFCGSELRILSADGKVDVIVEEK